MLSLLGKHFFYFYQQTLDNIMAPTPILQRVAAKIRRKFLVRLAMK